MFCRLSIASVFVLLWTQGVAIGAESQGLAEDLANSQNKLSTLERQENLALLRYHPVYFIYGNPDTKVQLSFKFLLVRTVPLYVGYTQLIFWRLNEPSKPFRDATYNPEIFYKWQFKDAHITSVDIGPWAHHSNGKKEEYSRSFDSSFIRLNTRWNFKNLNLLLTCTGEFKYNQDIGNEDLYRYHGPLEFQLSLINFFDIEQYIDKGDLTFRFFPGGKNLERWRSGGYELGYNFRFGALDIFPTLYLQYYQGFAESLINYNEHVRQFRVGISF